MEFVKGRKANVDDADVAVFIEPNGMRLDVRRGEIIHETRVRIEGVQWWSSEAKDMVCRALERRGMLHLRNYQRQNLPSLEGFR